MTTRAAQIINVLKILGLPGPSPAGSVGSLQARVKTAFGTDGDVQLEHQILLGLLYSLNALEQEIHVRPLRGSLQNECIQSIVNLRSILGPTHWASDPAQWQQQIPGYVRDLQIIDNFMSAIGDELELDCDASVELADQLEAVAKELSEVEVSDVKQRDKVVKIIRILAVLFRNLETSDLDLVIQMTLNAIFELALLKRQSGKVKTTIIAVGCCLSGAFAFAGHIREGVETAVFLRDVGISVNQMFKNPRLPGKKEALALEAPVLPREVKTPEEES
jgi:hypothetical protein